MLVQMNTKVYHHNTFIDNRFVIFKIYLKEYFLFEMVPLIFDSVKSNNLLIHIILRLTLLLKIKGIMIILKKTEFYIL